MLESEAPGFWKAYRLPETMDGMTFADVGCWEGYLCGEAVKRGAHDVLGVDYCTAESLKAYRERARFDFIQMDVFSEKFLQLPEYDVVLSAGVLYHTESPLAFLFRLRKLCRPGGFVYVETTVLLDTPSDRPLMVFHPGSDLDDNPSNWWSPNELCLRQMMEAAGLADIETTYFAPQDGRIGRICMRGLAANSPAILSAKVLPRRASYMPDIGAGDR